MLKNADMKILKSESKVRFQDCDPFNHLNNLKYIEYFINAREDHLLDYYDLDIDRYIRKIGQGWVVGTTKISYLRSAVQMEKITIESQLIAFSSRSLQVEMKMWDQAQTHVKALMWINFAYIDISKGKSTRHPSEMMEFFEKINEPVEQKSFDDRADYVRRINMNRQ